MRERKDQSEIEKITLRGSYQFRLCTFISSFVRLNAAGCRSTQTDAQRTVLAVVKLVPMFSDNAFTSLFQALSEAARESGAEGWKPRVNRQGRQPYGSVRYSPNLKSGWSRPSSIQITSPSLVSGAPPESFTTSSPTTLENQAYTSFWAGKGTLMMYNSIG